MLKVGVVLDPDMKALIVSGDQEVLVQTIEDVFAAVTNPAIGRGGGSGLVSPRGGGAMANAMANNGGMPRAGTGATPRTLGGAPPAPNGMLMKMGAAPASAGVAGGSGNGGGSGNPSTMGIAANAAALANNPAALKMLQAQAAAQQQAQVGSFKDSMKIHFVLFFFRANSSV
jgi:hypothetical protein